MSDSKETHVRISNASYPSITWTQMDEDMYEEGNAQKTGLILYSGEIGYESDTGKIKIGNGSSRWSDLSYWQGQSPVIQGGGEYSLIYDLPINKDEATGKHSIALGKATKALKDYSLALGNQTEADGQSSAALGNHTKATGEASFSAGSITEAVGDYSVALGDNTKAMGLGALATGNNTKAFSTSSFSTGHYTLAGSKCFTIIDVNATNKTFTLDSVDGLDKEDMYSAHICYISSSQTKSAQYENYGKITDIDTSTKTVTVDQFPTLGGIFTKNDDNVYVDEETKGDTEKNTFRIIAKPEAGTRLIGYGTMATGVRTKALSKGAVAFGQDTVAYGSYAYVEGTDTKAGYGSHAEGRGSKATGLTSHAEGINTIASGEGSHAEGSGTDATGINAHTEGLETTASGNYSHAEGSYTQATEQRAHAEGSKAKAAGLAAHAEGVNTYALGQGSHSEGDSSTLYNKSTTASDIESNWKTSITENKDRFSMAYGTGAHTEGSNCLAIGNNSHAEGQLTLAKSNNSHAEGQQTSAEAFCSHAEGYLTSAKGERSHAGGTSSTASHTNSFVHGQGLTTNYGNQFVVGQYNSSPMTSDGRAALFIVGNGTAANSPNCALISRIDGRLTIGNDPINDNDVVTLHYMNNNTCTYLVNQTNGGVRQIGTSSAAGDKAFACGQSTVANGDRSFAGGSNTTVMAGHTNAATFGQYTQSTQYNQMVVGQYNNISNSGYFIVGGGSSSSRSNCFRVTGSTVYAKSIYMTTGADYSEYFEWYDRNLNNQDRRGYFVTLIGDKIEIAKPNDYVLGIISSLPAVVGNGDESWNGQFLLDEFGGYITETYEYTIEETDKNTGDTVMVTKTDTRYKTNPDYDPTQPYIHRADRPEWSTVGMLGVLSVRDDGTCQVNGYCTVAEGGIATASETGYRVISRTNDHIVKIIFR